MMNTKTQIMKSINLFLVLFSFCLNAQVYKGIKLTKEQKTELKQICDRHVKKHDAFFSEYFQKINQSKYKDSILYKKLLIEYKFKKDSIENIVEHQMADVLDENQKKIFWDKVNKSKNNR